MRRTKVIAPRPKPKTIPFRPNERLRGWLEAEKERTGAPFQKIIEKALLEYQLQKKRAPAQ